jgi:hypothetical protein
LGKEPIFRDEDLVINDTVGGVVPSVKIYTMDHLPLQKNHDYEVVIPQRGLAPVVVDGNLVYPNQTADIRSITVRLFDILGREVDTLVFKPDQPEMPSIKNFLTFPVSENNSIRFSVFNNDIVPADISYKVRSTAPGSVGLIRSGTFFAVPSQESSSPTTEAGIPPGPGQIELTAQRPNTTPPVLSDSRILDFQMEDGIYDEFVFEPIVPSKTPLQLSAIPSDTRGEDEANRIVITWVDQNPESTEYRVRYRNVTTNSGILSSKPETTTTSTILFTDEQATALQGNVFEISVEALYNGIYSPAALLEVTLEVFSQIPNSVNSSTMNTNELIQNRSDLNFLWQDVLYESQYQLYWRYVNEIFPTLGDYPAERVVLLPANQTNFLFDASGAEVSNNPKIFKNAVVEVKVRGINANGVSANLGVREGVFRGNYDPALVVPTPVNGTSGFRITIPEALKVTDYGPPPPPSEPPGHVFETTWEVVYKKATDVNYTPGLSTPLEIAANGNNYFEVVDLEPETDYDVLFRGVLFTNGTRLTPLPFQPSNKVTVKTGTTTPVPLLAPTVLNQTVVQNPDNLLTFTLRNNDSKNAIIRYRYSTSQISDITTSDSASGTLGYNDTANLGPFAVAAGQTYYIRARAYPAAGVTADPSELSAQISITTPAFIFGTFFSSSGVIFNQQGGYSPLTLTNPGLPSGATGWNPPFPSSDITTSQNFNAVYPTPQTATPSTAIEEVLSTTVAFNITNNDAATATILWGIRQGSETGILVANNSNSVASGNTITVSASNLTLGTTYWLTNAFATASGKTQSLEGTRRSATTQKAWSYQGVFTSSLGISATYQYQSTNCPANIDSLSSIVRTWVQANYPPGNYAVGQTISVSVTKMLSGVQGCSIGSYLRYTVG